MGRGPPWYRWRHARHPARTDRPARGGNVCGPWNGKLAGGCAVDAAAQGPAPGDRRPVTLHAPAHDGCPRPPHLRYQMAMVWICAGACSSVRAAYGVAPRPLLYDSLSGIKAGHFLALAFLGGSARSIHNQAVVDVRSRFNACDGHAWSSSIGHVVMVTGSSPFWALENCSVKVPVCR